MDIDASEFEMTITTKLKKGRLTGGTSKNGPPLLCLSARTACPPSSSRSSQPAETASTCDSNDEIRQNNSRRLAANEVSFSPTPTLKMLRSDMPFDEQTLRHLFGQFGPIQSMNCDSE